MDLQDARQLSGFTVHQVAGLLRVTVRTVRNWEALRCAVPYSAVALVRVYGGLELPGDAWRGWCVVNGALYSPEGLRFDPWEMSWWSLTVLQARAWREHYERDRVERVAQLPIGSRRAQLVTAANGTVTVQTSARPLRGRGKRGGVAATLPPADHGQPPVGRAKRMRNHVTGLASAGGTGGRASGRLAPTSSPIRSRRQRGNRQ